MESANRMAEVAKMFGKKMGEEFVIQSGSQFRGRFTKEGLEGAEGYEWNEKNWTYELGSWLLTDLLTGKAVIIDEA
jgi:hypothetical protein